MIEKLIFEWEFRKTCRRALGYTKVYMEFGERNEKGNTNLDFTTSYSLMSVNIHFRI